MRWGVVLVLALPLAACRETVVFVQTPMDGGPGGATGFDGGPALCTGQPTGIEPEWPEIKMALDRSTGMSTARVGNVSVLEAVRQALDETSMRYQKVVRFGYIEFPGASQPQVCNSCGDCVGNLIAPTSNLEAFSFSLNYCQTGVGQTCPESESRPTASALARCSDTFWRPEQTRRYVLLVTNGQPDCGMGQISGCEVAKMLTRDLYNQLGVQTVVLAPGQPDQYTMACLDDLAVFGGTRLRTAPMVNDLNNELEDVLRPIAMNACRLDLFSQIQNDSRAAVFWKGAQVPHNQDSGWDSDHNGSEIVLHGTWCTNLIAEGPAALEVIPDCNPRP